MFCLRRLAQAPTELSASLPSERSGSIKLSDPAQGRTLNASKDATITSKAAENLHDFDPGMMA
jgi:hypothetical protein